VCKDGEEKSMLSSLLFTIYGTNCPSEAKTIKCRGLLMTIISSSKSKLCVCGSPQSWCSLVGFDRCDDMVNIMGGNCFACKRKRCHIKHGMTYIMTCNNHIVKIRSFCGHKTDQRNFGGENEVIMEKKLILTTHGPFALFLRGDGVDLV
jgi:hypothetical protein